VRKMMRRVDLTLSIRDRGSQRQSLTVNHVSPIDKAVSGVAGSKVLPKSL